VHRFFLCLYMTTELFSFCFNPFQENTYLIQHSADNTCLIIDPGCYTASEQQMLTAFIAEKGLKPLAIVNTHAHIDHILGLDYLRKLYRIPFYLHALEDDVLAWAPQSGKMWGFEVSEQESPEFRIPDSGSLNIGPFSLEVLFTPGRSPGSVCLLNAEASWLIGGDVLFRESIGRTDLPGGNHAQLLQSIREKLFVLPNETIVYPGHGPATEIGHERIFNPFVGG